MPEIVYCYTCNRGQPLQVQSTGLRTCGVCHNDELGETIDPGLVPPAYRPRPAEGWWCDRCNGAVDTVCLCARCHAVAERRWIPEFAADYRTRRPAPPAELVEEPLEDEAVEEAPAPRPYAAIAADIAATVERKQAAYGDSFAKVTRVLELMFPNGVPVEAYADLGGIVRTLDKLFRVATDRDALEENPWGDIAGYALLAIRRVEADKGRA